MTTPKPRKGTIATLPHAQIVKRHGIAALASLAASICYVVGFFAYLWYDRTE